MASERSLITAASAGAPTDVENALGRFRETPARVAAAARAAAAALGASNWDTLAYLADFLRDVTAPHPPDGGALYIGAGGPAEGEADEGGPDEGEAAEGGPDEGEAAEDDTAGIDVPLGVFTDAIVDCFSLVTGKDPRTAYLSELTDDGKDQLADCTRGSILAYVRSTVRDLT